ncbi:MAG: RagB/SusD family nutrient uptake outer membrane protein [Bacteroidales bacterium]|nr:RagB/SusD family nutrient uptake outer membrane protein [Bacteroidales bacterium]
MKTLYKIAGIFTVGFILLGTSGCEDFLNRYPDNALTEDQIFTNEKNAETAVIALYDLLSETYMFGRNVPLRGSLKGADFFHFIENPNLRFDIEYKYVEISSAAGYAGYLWNYCYKTIASCNLILTNLSDMEGDQEIINDLEAQTLAVKAICYLELVRSFSYPVWMAEEDDLYGMGVPLIKDFNDNSTAIETPPGRPPLLECYDYIEELLLDALDKIDKSRIEKQFFTEQSLWAILARFYLYTEAWEQSRDAAIMAESLGGSMIGSADFIAGMTTRFNVESIFEIHFDVNDNPGTSCLAYYAFKSVNEQGQIDANSIGYGDYGASNAFINLFSPEDIRNQLFKQDKTGSARAYHKYIGIESALIHDVPYIRLPEVLLIAAETYAELEDFGNALNYLNKVYSARTDQILSGITGQELKNEIFKERRRELALEGHELYDYLRTGRSFSRDGSHPTPLTIDPVNGREEKKFHRVVYPIPQPEMDANPNIRDQQNPGYAPYQGGI